MTIEEIFEGEEHLLDSPSVKKLMSHVETEYARTRDIARKYQKFYSDVSDAIMYSESVLKNGRSHKATVESILQLHSDF